MEPGPTGGTPARAAAELLASSEKLYRALVEQVPAVVYVDSHEHHPRSMYISPQVRNLYGRPAEDFLANPALWEETIHPGDRARVAAEWVAAVESEERFECEYRILAVDGTVRWVRDSGTLVHDEEGRPLFWQGVMHDITHSKRAEEALRESESRYRALVENLPAVVYVVAPDDDRKTLYVSPQIETALGYTREEWLEQPDIWMELLHPDDREPTLAAHDRHNETGEPWSREYRLIASDGRAVWFRDVATLIRDTTGNPLYWEGVQLDVTELKRAEEELRRARDELEFRVLERTHELEEANEMMSLEIAERMRAEQELRAARERYRLLVEQLPAVVYSWAVNPSDPAANYTSPAIRRLLGYTPEEWGTDPDFWISRIHPDDRQRVLAAFIRSETTGEPFGEEYRFLAKDGHIVWVLDEAALLDRDERGRPRTFQGVLLDITSRKEAEARATETELRYRTLAEQIPAVVYVSRLHPDPREPDPVRYISPHVATMLGYSVEEWTADPGAWLSALHPEDRGWVCEEVGRIEETGEPWSIEYRMLRKDGRTVWVRDEGRMIGRDELGRPDIYQGLMLDITEQKRAEAGLRAAEQRYRVLVEQLPAMTYIELPDPDPGRCHLVYLSPQAEAITGYTPEEIMGDPSHLAGMLHPDDRDRVLAANARSEETGEPFDQEYRIHARDGRVVWLHSKAELVRDSQSRALYWHGVAIDTTALRTAEESLRRLEERFQSLAAGRPHADRSERP